MFIYPVTFIVTAKRNKRIYVRYRLRLRLDRILTLETCRSTSTPLPISSHNDVHNVGRYQHRTTQTTWARRSRDGWWRHGRHVGMRRFDVGGQGQWHRKLRGNAGDVGRWWRRTPAAAAGDSDAVRHHLRHWNRRQHGRRRRHRPQPCYALVCHQHLHRQPGCLRLLLSRRTSAAHCYSTTSGLICDNMIYCRPICYIDPMKVWGYIVSLIFLLVRLLTILETLFLITFIVLLLLWSKYIIALLSFHTVLLRKLA